MKPTPSPQTPPSIAGRDRLPAPARTFLDQLVGWGLLDPEEGEAFLADRADRLREYLNQDLLMQALSRAGLLTPFQVDRLRGGSSHGLILGGYRVREELGKGGMGTVYLAEHRLMKRRVAIKVVPVDEECPAGIKLRFFSEMRLLAELSHPNVVFALDAGEVPAERGRPPLVYLVMELVDGGDLEQYTMKHGLLGVNEACSIIRQAAAGLQAAHDRHLVHRDLKPSNLLLTSSRQVKLVDFGLARQFSSRLTDPRALLGSVEFMPPEQSHDPSAVGKEADIYGLGATLFWLLTGEGPYPFHEHIGQALRVLQQQEPRRLRELRPDVPPALDDLVARMLQRNPSHRPASALAVVNAIAPFAASSSGQLPVVGRHPAREAIPSGQGLPRVLIVDDDLRVRLLHRAVLEQLGCECHEARDGATALAATSGHRFDLVLLDLALPDLDGNELCRLLRERLNDPHSKLLVVAETSDQDRLPSGADDCIARPFDDKQLTAKVRQVLELKLAQDSVGALTDQVSQANEQMEQSLRARKADLREAHNALLFAMAKIAESRDGETPGHLRRMQCYTRTLALEANKTAPWQGLVDDRFLEQLQRCVPLHDIGKIGLPDEILLKPATLTPAERTLVETHPLIGDRILEALSKEYGTSLDFLGTARVIVRHHHERYDGKGYPDRLMGDAIPPAARLVAVADVYDALRRMRMYKPAMSHRSAIHVLTERSHGQFDPHLVRALLRCQAEFEQIYRDLEE